LPPLSNYTETELVALLQAKDAGAFSYLYDNYSAALNGVIYRMVEDRALSEDILQEVFVKVWNNIGSYDAAKGKLFTWLINITRNLTIDTIRSKGYKKQQQILSDENSVHNLAADRSGAGQFDTLGLRKQVALLKPEQRRMIDLAYFEGYTQDEISKETGIPLGTVKTRMRAAITELRKLIVNT